MAFRRSKHFSPVFPPMRRAPFDVVTLIAWLAGLVLPWVAISEIVVHIRL
jgi:hypothetical protein